MVVTAVTMITTTMTIMVGLPGGIRRIASSSLITDDVRHALWTCVSTPEQT